MQLRTTFLSILVLALTIGQSTSAEPIRRRAETEPKLSKRSPKHGPTYVTHHHYNTPPPAAGSTGGGGGLFGGGSMAKNIVGGSLLAGGASFAATGGSMAAKHLFSHDDEREERGGSGEYGGEMARGQPQPQAFQQAPMYQAPPAGGSYQASMLGGAGGGAGAGGGGAAVPILIVMSDGTWQSYPSSELQQDLGQAGGEEAMQSSRAQYPVAAGQPNTGSPFTFPKTA